jgi:ferredoxin
MARDESLALAVDRIRCDGYGMCAELLPEMIELDEWGYPILTAGSVPPKLVSLARQAVDVCPVLALRLVSRAGAQERQGARAVAAPTVFVRSR